MTNEIQIYSEIMRKINEYIRLKNEPPKRLIVGKVTHIELAKYSHNYIQFKSHPTLRDSICGLYIYTIDDDFYLEAGP